MRGGSRRSLDSALGLAQEAGPGKVLSSWGLSGPWTCEVQGLGCESRLKAYCCATLAITQATVKIDPGKLTEAGVESL